jgi:hypothetical protein
VGTVFMAVDEEKETVYACTEKKAIYFYILYLVMCRLRLGPKAPALAWL